MRTMSSILYGIHIIDNKAKFIWDNTNKDLVNGSIDLLIDVNVKDIVRVAKIFKCEITNIDNEYKIIIPNYDVYNRLLIYAYVKPLLNNNEKLIRIVISMDYVDAMYWASKFREAWWYENIWKYNLAKAFKLFFIEG
jgi:tRNA U38,U39,U40 pseudouridine synthase TruA